MAKYSNEFDPEDDVEQWVDVAREHDPIRKAQRMAREHDPKRKAREHDPIRKAQDELAAAEGSFASDGRDAASEAAPSAVGVSTPREG